MDQKKIKESIAQKAKDRATIHRRDARVLDYNFQTSAKSKKITIENINLNLFK